jgi:3-oxoacyl-[acyl-carrier protein] reductase
MDLGLDGRRAAVAASSAGLGLAAARALAAEGAHVAICGRDPQRLDRAADSIRAAGSTRAGGGSVVAIVADVGSPDGATSFVEQAADGLGGSVDVLVPNAGGPPPGTFRSTDLDGYRTALDLNLMSTIAMCRAAVPAMCDAGWGRVVAITSIGARQPIAQLAASTVARTAVTGFLKVLATEVAPHGVTVNSLQPGVHDTDRLAGLAPGATDALLAEVPAGHLGDPAGFGAALAFLCSASAAFITGAALPVDGGAARALQ